jgi:PAS domain S-box-containing protein
MDAPYESSAHEVTRLRDCLNDLVNITAPPARWAGDEPTQMVSTLLDALLGSLRLSFVVVRVNDREGAPSSETMRVAETSEAAPQHDVSFASARLGLRGEIGIIVAGAERLDFPAETDKIILHVAATQAAMALQQAQIVAERRRARARERFRVIVDDLPVMVTLMTPDGEFAEGNRYMLEYFGAPLEELKRRPTTYSFHPEDRPSVDARWKESVETGQPYDFEARLRRADGTYRWFHTRGFPLRDPEGRVVLWHLLQTDVDDRKQAEDALNKARAELANVSRVATLGALTASIAHEVNQPLSGIITNASTCLRMLDAEPPNVDGARETARRTIRDANRAADVITRLRSLFTKKEFALELLDLNEVTREVIALSLSDLQRNRVVLQSELAGDLPAITGDRVQLQQVILNLLRNASDAMLGVHDRPRHLLIRTECEASDRVRVSVRDAGVGFDPQSANKLFDVFYTTKSDGMGVGLSVSRSIVERHHGRLWAEPNSGPGATFSFSVPCAPESIADAATEMRNA